MVIYEHENGIPFCRMNGVDMTKRQFSNTEVEYLRALPAVESVTENRITYSRDFQISCMRRYLDGERPSTIFTSAGLSPAIIGRKRVERSIARWKVDLDMLESGSGYYGGRKKQFHDGRLVFRHQGTIGDCAVGTDSIADVSGACVEGTR